MLDLAYPCRLARWPPRGVEFRIVVRSWCDLPYGGEAPARRAPAPSAGLRCLRGHFCEARASRREVSGVAAAGGAARANPIDHARRRS